MSSDGTVIIAGASESDHVALNAGMAQVYAWNGTAWVLRGDADDLIADAAGDAFGCSVAMSSDGTIVAIGALAVGGDAGQVRVFEWSGGAWGQLGTDIDGGAVGDELGSSVALSSDGTVLAIGAPESTNGHVEVYVYSGGVWNVRGADIVGAAANDNFGKSVALSSDGTVLAVGANRNDDGGLQAGHVEVYVWNGAAWLQRGTAIEGSAGENVGYSVALSSDGTVLAVGAPDETSGGPGKVRIYTWNGVWNQTGGDMTGTADGDTFGYHVAMSSDGTVVASGAGGNYAKVFVLSSGNWIQRGLDINGAAGDQLGESVALSSDGSIVATGLPAKNTAGGTGAGAVRVLFWNSVCFANPHQCRVLMADGRRKPLLGLRPGDQMRGFNGKSIEVGRVSAYTLGKCQLFEFKPFALGYKHETLTVTRNHIVLKQHPHNAGLELRPAKDMHLLQPHQMVWNRRRSTFVAHVQTKGNTNALINVNGVWAETADVHERRAPERMTQIWDGLGMTSASRSWRIQPE